MKVSVVVPTFRTGKRLDALVASLDAQSLPAGEFEVIFVDDGSGDDTVERLERIAAERPHVAVHAIENSGWPSRPRNVGLDSASGEYVLFMDHDDELYPDALRRGHEFAAEHAADVLNGKESRTGHPKWAIDVYTRNFANAIDRSDVHPLLPLNPHKLFRREFLLEHGIRFPEGGRVLWEDIYHNAQVARHAQVVSVLADTPFYHWVQHETNSSSAYAGDVLTYWDALARVMRYTDAQLTGERHARSLDLMVDHQLRTRVLPAVGPSLFARDDGIRDAALSTAEAIVRDLVPERLDAALPRHLAARLHLLRAGERALLRRLVTVDDGVLGIGTATGVRWDAGALVVKTTSTWRADGGASPLSIARTADRIRRVLPSDVTDALPPELLDVTRDVDEATALVGIRSRDERVTWMVPGTGVVRVAQDQDGAVQIAVDTESVVDVESAAMGNPLRSAVWDLNSRNVLFGTLNHRGLRTEPFEPLPALVGGRTAVAYVNTSGMLSLDLDERARSFLATVSGFGAPVVASEGMFRCRFAVPLDGVAVSGAGRISADVRIGDAVVAGSLIGDEAGARIEASAQLRPGVYPLFARLRRAERSLGHSLRVRLTGRVTVEG